MFHEKNEKIRKKSRWNEQNAFRTSQLGMCADVFQKTQIKAILFVNLAVMFNFM